MLHNKIYTLKNCCILLGIAACIALAVLGSIANVAGQPQIELVIDPIPDGQTIYLGSGLKEIWVEVRVSGEPGELTWHVDGPGEFNPVEGGLGGIYTVPETLDGSSAEASITASVSDSRGKTIQDRVSFALIAPQPTPTPTPVPTPTPTPTPVPAQIHQTLLQQEKYYLQPGETVSFIVTLTNPSAHHIELKCTAVKGTAECSTPEDTGTAVSQREVLYIAPQTSGKDMLNIQIIDSESEKTDHQLIKIEIREM